MKMSHTINQFMFQKLQKYLMKSLAFMSIAILLVTFSAVGNEENETKLKEEEVVKNAKKNVTDTNNSAIQKPNQPSSENSAKTNEPTKEVITGTADVMERDQKAGITILIGKKEQAKTIRFNEQGVEIGFLNADKITLKTNPETGDTTEIIAEGNVEIRDQDIFATCDHATMNNLTNIIVLKENVVVLQNKDRLETKLFTFNRTTGKQIGEGDVKFKVTVTQATPTESEDGEGTEKESTPTETDENKEKNDNSESTNDGEEKSDNEGDTEKKDTESDSSEKIDSEQKESEETDKKEETEKPETEDTADEEKPETEDTADEETPESTDTPESEETEDE